MYHEKIQLLIRIGLALAPLFLVGCGTYNSGNSNAQNFSKFMELEKNKASKKIVYESIGQPHDVKYFENSQSMWTYFYLKAKDNEDSWGLVDFGLNTSTSSLNANTTITDFFFNSKGICQKTSRYRSDKDINPLVGVVDVIRESAKNKAPERVEREMIKLGLPFDKKVARRMLGIKAFAR